MELVKTSFPLPFTFKAAPKQPAPEFQVRGVLKASGEDPRKSLDQGDGLPSALARRKHIL